MGDHSPPTVVNYEESFFTLAISLVIKDRLYNISLVKTPHLFSPADVFPTNKYLRQSHRPALGSNHRLELVAERRVNGDVPLVHGDAEATEDGTDGAAVSVRAADAAQRRGVDDDANIGVGNVGVVIGEGFPEWKRGVSGAAVEGVVVAEGTGEEKRFLGGVDGVHWRWKRRRLSWSSGFVEEKGGLLIWNGGVEERNVWTSNASGDQ
ncbi:hypothetical protein M5K25_000934 [Dendrobium thyrsiflorum]|uniref:Uncharacterized protein n=1 Tax=Dendrobium thyrsiflorum TaxID=117978 RepID=A0ABD0VVF6_DENTH